MESVNQTRPHRVNQMGKTHSKPLTARHAMCESAFNMTINNARGNCSDKTRWLVHMLGTVLLLWCFLNEMLKGIIGHVYNVTVFY